MQFKLFALITLSFFFACVSEIAAQDAKPRREVGLQFNNINFSGGGFSAFIKKEKKENVYRRIRFFSGRLSAGVFQESFELNFSAGIAIGREKRKQLDPKLEFYQGPEFSASVLFAAMEEDDARVFVAPAFGWVLGLQHHFNERWAVNIEAVPSVSLAVTSDAGDGVDQFLFNASVNNAVSLGLVRKF